MDIATRPPQTPVLPRSVASAPRRWPRRLAMTAVIVTGAVVAIGLAWVLRLEPFEGGSSTFAARSSDLPVRTRSIDAFDVSGDVSTVKTPRDGAFTYIVSIVNDGPVPVTISSIGRREDGPVTTQPVAMVPDPFSAAGQQWVSFAPTTLHPGQEAWYRIRGEIREAGCGRPGGTVSWWWEPVTFRVLGITRQGVAPTRQEIRVRAVSSC